VQNPSLMDHQAKAVKKLGNGKILKGGTGTGKTRTALAYYSQYAPWMKLYVVTTALKRDTGDWEDEATLWGVECTVLSWNALHDFEDIEGAFFIFDEQRVVGKGVWVKAFLRVTKKNQWILLSATPGDTWIDYAPVFIANGFYPNRTEFFREHVVLSRFMKFPKVERILGEQRLERQLKSILVEMEYERHTKRREIDVFAEYDIDLFKSVWRGRWNYLEERPVRNVAELFSLMRRVLNSHTSRLDRIRDLLIKHPRMIIFYNFDYELEILRSLDVVSAEWNGHKHERVPEGNEWVYLVQYAAGAEAWNCITTDTVVFYSLTYSYRMFEQSKGRIDRINTGYTNLNYYIIRSATWLDNAIWKCLEGKKNFNETKALKEEGV
jgi:hypothetical protein